MTVKEHYDNHLADYYSWMIGDFQVKKNEFLEFCREQNIWPEQNGVALDLGAGNGIQSVALAELGFRVTAIDFNQALLDELDKNKNGFEVHIAYDDIKNIKKYKDKEPELIICWGDTLPHLESENEISKLIVDIKETMASNGKIMVSFRDYSTELTDEKRFIPVKSDSNRILTCFLEYFDSKVRVTDLLYEKIDEKWVQKVSSYEKVKINKEMMLGMLKEHGFDIVSDKNVNRMICLVGKKI